MQASFFEAAGTVTKIGSSSKLNFKSKFNLPKLVKHIVSYLAMVIDDQDGISRRDLMCQRQKYRH